jgi:hypothetical protein
VSTELFRSNGCCIVAWLLSRYIVTVWNTPEGKEFCCKFNRMVYRQHRVSFQTVTALEISHFNKAIRYDYRKFWYVI